MVDLNNIYLIMRPELDRSLREIKKYYKGRSLKTSPYSDDIKKEFKEWIRDSFQGSDDIWTLPDLTKMERYENFCRSISKKIN